MKVGNRVAADLRTVRELLNQAARRDVMPSTAAALRLAAISLGHELMADAVHPLQHQQWSALATLLGVMPSLETVAAMLAKRGRP